MLTHDVVCKKCKSLFQIDDDEAEYMTVHEISPDCGCPSNEILAKKVSG